ncbi:MAG: glutathione S-transferase family protein [Alphaproteobacteria bacterium]
MVELYHSNWSICAQKVRLVLAEKSQEVVRHHLDLRAREQQTPAYLQLNPKVYVPTLVHDGCPIVESALICEYLDEVFAEPALRPSDPVDRAKIRAWTRRPDDGLHRACATLTNAIAFRLQWLEKPKDEIEAMLVATPDPVRREWRRAMIDQGTETPIFRRAVWNYAALLTDMENALHDGRYRLMGEAYTLADVSLTSYLNRVAELQLQPMWEHKRPRVTAWFDRIQERPNFASVYVDYPYEAYRTQMADQGRANWPKVEAILSTG